MWNGQSNFHSRRRISNALTSNGSNLVYLVCSFSVLLIYFLFLSQEVQYCILHPRFLHLSKKCSDKNVSATSRHSKVSMLWKKILVKRLFLIWIFSNSADKLFYEAPCFVTHIDDRAIATLTKYYS